MLKGKGILPLCSRYTISHFALAHDNFLEKAKKYEIKNLSNYFVKNYDSLVEKGFIKEAEVVNVNELTEETTFRNSFYMITEERLKELLETEKMFNRLNNYRKLVEPHF